MVETGNTKGGSITVLLLKQGILKGEVSLYHDLLFDWFRLVCFPNKNKNCQLSHSWFQTSQTGGQQYRDTSTFSIPCLKKAYVLPCGSSTSGLRHRPPSGRFQGGQTRSPGRGRTAWWRTGSTTATGWAGGTGPRGRPQMPNLKKIVWTNCFFSVSNVTDKKSSSILIW